MFAVAAVMLERVVHQRTRQKMNTKNQISKQAVKSVMLFLHGGD